MPSQTIVITGASDGIGAAAARRLSADGNTVVLVGRSRREDRGRGGRAGGCSTTSPTSPSSTRSAGWPTSSSPSTRRIDVLANNAGGIMGHRQETGDGFELTFQVNHLAPFLLTNLLLPTLIASQAKVIQTASIAARMFGHLDLDDLGLERGYSPDRAYGNGKLANILFTRELDRRYGDQGIAAAAFHPGIVGTNFASDTTHPMRFLYQTPLVKNLFTISPRARRPRPRLARRARARHDVADRGVLPAQQVARSNPQARDPQLARGLWDRSAEMVGL